MIPECDCDQCRYERACEAMGINKTEPGNTAAIICFRDSPSRPQYLRPNLMTGWLLTHGYEWTACGRMLMEVGGND